MHYPVQTNTQYPAGPSSSTYTPSGAMTGSGSGKEADPSSGSYTVLRIKRKATDAPLSSLVIQESEPRLRNTKRRRDVSGRPRGVFRLAETVPDTWKGRGQEGEVLKSRIQNLLSSSSQPDSPISPPASLKPREIPPAVPSLDAAPDASVSASASTISDGPSSADVGGIISDQGKDGAASTATARSPLPTATQPQPQTQSSSAGPSQTQFRVVPPLSPRTKAMMPPRLLTTAETEGDGSSPLVFVDAQAVSPSKPRNSGKPINPQEEKDMAAFLPMLKEYLKFEESQSKPPSPKVEPAEDEWVYDLYYRDNRAAGSAPLGLGVGDGVSIGELLGFEDISPPSSISGSEPEDEADEDSNDEDYYRNDYPEDEDADEDMEGFRPGYDDDDDEQEEDQWSESDYGDQDNDDRGEWGYRG